MMMEMTSFSRSLAAAAAMSVSAPPESPPGALRSTAFKMKGTVNTPRTFVVTVSMSAITPLPRADVTSVTPEVNVVGTQAKSARPYRNSTGSNGICTRAKPNMGVTKRIVMMPYASAARWPSAFLISAVLSVRPEMKKITTMQHVCAMGKSPLIGVPSSRPGSGHESARVMTKMNPSTR